MGPQSEIIFEKNIFFHHFYPLKQVQDLDHRLKKYHLSYCVSLYYWHLDPIPLITTYRGVEKLQIVKVDVFHFSKKTHLKGLSILVMGFKNFSAYKSEFKWKLLKIFALQGTRRPTEKVIFRCRNRKFFDNYGDYFNYLVIRR